MRLKEEKREFISVSASFGSHRKLFKPSLGEIIIFFLPKAKGEENEGIYFYFLVLALTGNFKHFWQHTMISVFCFNYKYTKIKIRLR